MIKLRGKYKFYAYSFGIFLLLTLIRLIWNPMKNVHHEKPPVANEMVAAVDGGASAKHEVLVEETPAPASPDQSEKRILHPIRGVHDYGVCFPDLQEVQIVAAKQWGVEPPYDRAEAERRKDELVYVGSSPYYHIDPGMSSSIPYLVPRASVLLNRIGRNFFDSLYVKGVPLHKIIVSSVLRSEQDVEDLRKINGNASPESCHRYGTTFDVCYTRFHTVSPPDGPSRRLVRDDTLKFVLSEVLRDLRADSACYVKYEIKQSCFHITVR